MTWSNTKIAGRGLQFADPVHASLEAMNLKKLLMCDKEISNDDSHFSCLMSFACHCSSAKPHKDLFAASSSQQCH